jgi:IMP dehydrogenase
VLVVNDAFELRGMITVKDIQKAERLPEGLQATTTAPARRRRRRHRQRHEERVTALVEAGVDVLVVDTAHGHSQGVLDRVRWIKDHFPDVQVIGGNIATGDAAGRWRRPAPMRSRSASARAPSAPRASSPASACRRSPPSPNVNEALAGTGVPLIADGGLRYSGDIAKVIAAGAHSVMIGSLFAGTDEAPGEVEIYQGRSYKSYRGMGSLGAMGGKEGSSDRYFQEQPDKEKLVPEGIEGRVPYKGSVLNVITPAHRRRAPPAWATPAAAPSRRCAPSRSSCASAPPACASPTCTTCRSPRKRRTTGPTSADCDRSPGPRQARGAGNRKPLHDRYPRQTAS